MMATIDKLVSVYKTLLKLYPTHFQNEYGEEMVIVFRKACSDCAKISSWSVWQLMLRELRDLPTNLIREHCSDNRRNSMENQMYFREPLPKSILRGTLSFGVGFTVVFLIFCLIDTLLNSGNNPWQGSSLWNWKSTFLHPTALAYSLGAVVMGIKTNKRKAWLSALGAFLIYTLLYRIWLVIPTEQQNVLISTGLEPYVLSTINGLFVGGFIGIIQQGWKKWGWFAGAGVIGFNLGWVVRCAVSNFLFDHSPFMRIYDLLRVGDPWYFILFLTPIIFYGLILGICMGLSGAVINRFQNPRLVD